MDMKDLKTLVREELILRLDEAKKKKDAFMGINPPEMAKHLGLHYGGWGTWLDETGDSVAKTVQGSLVKTIKP